MAFSVKGNLLNIDGKPVTFRKSPNVGGKITPTLLVMHYTASQSAAGAISWLCNPAAKASAHLVIDEAGAVTQLAPFNVATWHAGRSSWRGRSGCNAFSVGIELVNPGWLTKVASGKFVDTTGKAVPADRVVQLEGRFWKTYAPAQIEAAAAVAQAICAAYGITQIAGHEDIAPGRKTDPGPAFPMDSFVSRVFGRDGDEPDPVHKRLYTVQRGDTLTKIAKAAGASVKAILAANPGIDPNKIEVGQKLVIAS